MARSKQTSKRRWDFPIRSRHTRTPTVLQMEAVECGAAALGSILGYYKKFVPLEELRTMCGVSRDGSKAKNILRAARHYGLEAKGYKRSAETVLDSRDPCIRFWNFNHFLVFEGCDSKHVFLNDPASGPKTVSHEEFDHGYTGVALGFKPGSDFETGGEPSTWTSGLKTRFKGSETALAYTVLAGLFLVLPGLVIPIFSKLFIDQLLVANMEHWLRPLLLAMGIALLIQGALTWLQQYYLLRFERKLALVESARFLWHVMRLPMTFFSQRMTGDISNRVASNDRVAALLSGDLASSLISCCTLVFYAALMFSYDVLLTLVGIAAVLTNILLMRRVARLRMDGNTRLMQDQAKLYGLSQNGLASIETIKANGAERDFYAMLTGQLAKVVNAQQKLSVPTQYLNAVPGLLQQLTNFSILGLGGFRVMAGDLTMGELVAFQALMGSFIAPVNQLVGLGHSIQDIKADMTRLDDVFRYPVEDAYPVHSDEDRERSEGDSEGGPPNQTEAGGGGVNFPASQKLQGFITIRNLTFGYSPLEAPLIRNFSLDLKPGSRVALVGGSGSGKSTIARLVAGLFRPWDGDILFDDFPREHWGSARLAHSLAMVDQEVFLFEGTIRENLTLWNPAIPEHQVLQAARDAQIHNVIAARPQGYESKVKENGINFSGGQMQRLEIARALTSNPSILVLDEATSALDPLTEQQIDENLRKRGITCLIVAHRLSTIRDCDEIIVMERGEVIERGAHDSLLADDGAYAQLIQD